MTETEHMTRGEFESALDLHGGELARWPTMVRERAEQLLAVDAEARAELARAGRIEGVLRRAIEPRRLSAFALGRVLGSVEQRRRKRLPSFFLEPQRAAIAMTFAAFMVFGLGAWTANVVETQADEVELAALGIEDAPLFGGE